MTQIPVMSAAAIQQVIAGHFPGLLGVELLEVGPERVIGRLPVRPEICTVGGILHGGAVMGFAKALGEFGATITFVAAIPGQTRTIASALATKPNRMIPRRKTTSVTQDRVSRIPPSGPPLGTTPIVMKPMPATARIAV